MAFLGVNIDHVATLREARKEGDPNLLDAAFSVIRAGADSLTVHLREDRRHIQDRDVFLLKEQISVPMNLELSTASDIVDIALDVQPEYCCLVPENRKELTTEGGLDVLNHQKQLSCTIDRLKNANIFTNIFIDPDVQQIQAALDLGVDGIEIHTGRYACYTQDQSTYQAIISAVRFAKKIGLRVDAGHGLNYHNVALIAALKEIHTLNIGHAIVARSIFTGLHVAVSDMQALMT